MYSLSPHQPTEVGSPSLQLERTPTHRAGGAGGPALCSGALGSWGTGETQQQASQGGKALAELWAGRRGARLQGGWCKDLGFLLFEPLRTLPQWEGLRFGWLWPPGPAPDSPCPGALRRAEVPQRRQKKDLAQCPRQSGRAQGTGRDRTGRQQLLPPPACLASVPGLLCPAVASGATSPLLPHHALLPRQASDQKQASAQG